MHADRPQIKDLARLKNRADFLKIQSTGQKWISQGLILQAKPNELGSVRVGFTVSKKVDVSAVKRNRIKRRLRAAAADVLSLHARESADYVLIGRGPSLDRPFAELEKDLNSALKRLHRTSHAGADKGTP